MVMHMRKSSKAKKRVKEEPELAEVLNNIQLMNAGLLELPEPKHIDYAMPCVHTPYITIGYRVDYDHLQCLLSLFTLHNETMNIWSHLIGFICTVIAGISICMEFQEKELPFYGRMAFATYIVGAAVCLLFSAVYHTFGCISALHQQWLLVLDLGGVACLTGGSLFVWIVYGFHCMPSLSLMYSCFAGIIFLTGVVIAFLGAYNTDAGFYTRVIGFATIASLGTIPCIHWYFITPEEIQRELIMGVVGTFSAYAVGLGFYVTRFPEIWWPSNYFVTHFIPSHMWWHLCVCAAVGILIHQAR